MIVGSVVSGVFRESMQAYGASTPTQSQVAFKKAMHYYENLRKLYGSQAAFEKAKPKFEKAIKTADEVLLPLLYEPSHTDEDGTRVALRDCSELRRSYIELLEIHGFDKNAEGYRLFMIQFDKARKLLHRGDCPT